MIKVLFLTNDLGSQKGGQELANVFLLGNLCDFCSFTIFNQQFFKEEWNYKKIDFDINLDFRKGFLDALFDLIKNLRCVNKERFDLVLVSATPFSGLLYFFIIKSFFLFRNARIINFCHIDPLSSVLRASRFPFILYPLGLFLYRRLDKIVVTNPFMAETFKKYYFVDKDKIVIIPYPLRDDFFELLRMRPEKKLPKGRNIITVTRLETSQKDPLTLIKAFSIVKRKIKDANLIICGVGPDENQIRDLAKELKVSDSVYFFGFVKNPISLIKRSDVFALSSKSEGTPISLIEALACGLPIVATDCPVGPRWILDNGKGGFLVPVGNHLKMAEAISYAIESRKGVEKKISRQKILAKRFYPEIIVRKWKFFLSNICDVSND